MLRNLPVRDTLLILIGLLFLTFFGVAREQRTALKVDTYSSYDARSGGYRAWYELLEREGVGVERFERHWAFLDPTVKTLILAFPLPFDATAASPTRADRAALGEWVASGGRLISLGGLPAAPDEGFKGVRYHTLSSNELRSLGVRRDTFEKLVVREGALGQGTIIQLDDRSLFDNHNIGRADGARLAYTLGACSWWDATAKTLRHPGCLAGDGKVAFDETLHGHLVPEHWWLIAPRRLVVALAIALGVGMIAVLGASIRLGPPLNAPLRREPTSAEYVDAVASLYARGGAMRKVLNDVLTSANRAVATTYGENDAPEEMRSALGELELLASLPQPGKRELVRGVALAHFLRIDRRP